MAFATGMGRPMDLMAALTENDKLRSQVIDRNKKISELERLLFEIRVKGTMVCIHSDFDSPHREGFKAVGSGPDIFYWHKLLDPWADAFDMVRKLKSFLGSDLTPRMLINLMVTKRHTKPCNEDRTERNKCGDLNKWHMNLKLTTELLDRPMDDDDAGDCAEYLKQKIVFQTCAACNLEKLWFRDAPHDPFCQGINEFSVLAGELTRCGHTVCSACLLQSIRNSVDGLERCGALVDRGIPESFGCPAPGCQLYLDIPHLAALEQTLHRLGSQDVAALINKYHIEVQRTYSH
ncbi:hypothetical protein B0T25DRAFT_571732 [Lasiosphaeria hispida]|uniref:RING-type domain-containing protein n=1 Tax=Lasiosphaeria hispida TaxID=260671 RepID=A0AAJ0HBL9_9PEZI|nr:hypothetical protein B0T25DRAFT_571732 [Lasiosphaeria hispida]